MKTPIRRLTPGTSAVGVSGAASIVLVWALGLAGIEVPPEVASAMTLLISALASQIVRDQPPRGAP